eukprot:Gb_26162 [translate_table: standard]
MKQSSESVEDMQDKEKPRWFYKIVEDQRPNEMLQTQGRTRSQNQKARRQQVNLALMSSVIDAYEPNSFEEACKNQTRIDAMQVEYNALLKNQTW